LSGRYPGRPQPSGTPAPWAPPKNLVVSGPYCYVRNPMISGVLFVLGAECLLLGSWALALWLAMFFTANALLAPGGGKGP